MLDLKRVQAFVLVAETGSVAKAAERLRISESPLSRQVIALERELGVALFERRGRRLRLTPPGERFLGRAQALLAEAAELERDAGGGRGTAGAVRLALVGGVSWHAGFGRAVRELRRAHPAIGLALAVQPAAAVAAGPQEDAYDLALMRRPLTQAGLASRRLAAERLVLIAAEALGPLTLARLRELPWIEPPGKPAPAIQAALRDAGLDGRQRIESPELATGVALARAGAGVMLTQAGVAESLAGMRTVAAPFACPPLEIHLGWRRRAAESPAVAAVRALLERHVADAR